MKKYGVLLVLFLFSMTWHSCNKGNKTTSEKAAVIEFDTIKHDFGVLPFMDDAEFEFEFTNTGSVPLLVTHVKSTCGCTIPEWSKEPVNSNDKGKIHVSYDTHRVGAFAKSIYVYSNASNGAQRLTITGKVNRAPEEDQPLTQ